MFAKVSIADLTQYIVIGIYEVLRTLARRMSFQKGRQLQDLLFPTEGKNRNDS